MTLLEWMGVGSGLVALAGPLVTWGMMRQQISDLKQQVGGLATISSVHGLEAHVSNLATKESVSAIEGRVGVLETDMREAREALVTIPVISEQLKGFEKLMTVQMDEVRHGVRNLRSVLEGYTPPRRRSTT